MTMTAAATDEVSRYLADVAARLVCLDPEERAELLADLEQHLLEVAAEEGTPLHERLGPPDAYAAELLASVGFEPAPPPGATWLTRVVDSARRISSTPTYQSTRAFVRTLRPAWLLARGLIVAWLLADLLAPDSPRVSPLLVPELGPTVLPGLLLVAAGVAGSMYIAQHMPASRGWKRAVVLADVGLCLFALSLAGQLVDRLYASPMVVYANAEERCLLNGDGNVVENLYPYDAEGRPLDQVLLYDQTGRPLDNLCPSLPAEYARDVNGATVVNAFPRRQSAYPTDEAVTPPPMAPPAIVPPRLATSTTTSTTTTTSTP